MNEELLKEKRDTHERRIDNHAERLDKLEMHEAARFRTKLRTRYARF